MTTNAAAMRKLLAAGADDATALVNRGDRNRGGQNRGGQNHGGQNHGGQPSVLHGVTAGVPHDQRDEEVADVVVLHDGAEPTAAELRTDAAPRPADFKVPKKVVSRPEIPKGATGKLQRIGLAQVPGLG